MSLENSILGFLSQCAEQNRLLSANVANVNTPNFKAIMVKEFAHQKNLLDIKMACTSNYHISRMTSSSILEGGIKSVPMNGEEKPNGNNVNLLQQMSELSRNYAKNEAALALFRNAFDFSHVAITSKT